MTAETAPGVKRYRKKPIEVEAIQWTGENFPAIKAFASGAVGVGELGGRALPLWTVKSKAVCHVQQGDWIIREPDGSGFYPCERDVFAATYQPAADPIHEHAKSITAAIFACREKDCPMPFALYRNKDVTGVSGEGTVAHGAQFADGQVVIRWLGENPSTVVWGSLDTAMNVHGHDGRTRVVWLAAPFSEMGKAEDEAAAAERERIAKLAEEVDAFYDAPCPEGDPDCVHQDTPFADFIRGQKP